MPNSDDNEQTEIGMTSTNGSKIIFKQIAGLIARRIVCKLKQGDEVNTGERFGLIRFGSRAELFLPAGSTVDVKIGDMILGAETIIGHLPDNK